MALEYAHWMRFGKTSDVSPEDLALADASRFGAADVIAWELKGVYKKDPVKPTAKSKTKAKATALNITSFMIAKP